MVSPEIALKSCYKFFIEVIMGNMIKVTSLSLRNIERKSTWWLHCEWNLELAPGMNLPQLDGKITSECMLHHIVIQGNLY